MFWPTTGVGQGPAGGYSDADWQNMLEALFVSDRTVQGVIPNYKSSFSTTISGSDIIVGTGAAVVCGVFIYSDTVLGVTIPASSGGTTAHRLVLRLNNTTHRIDIHLISAANGVSTPPAKTQTAGSIWDIDLYYVYKDAGQVVTLTDVRGFTHFGTRVSTNMLDDGVALANIGPEGITPAYIANRTRTVFAPAQIGYDTFTQDVLYPINTANGGIALPNAEASLTKEAYVFFGVPNDFVSDLTAAPILYSAVSGDVVISHAYEGGVAGVSGDAIDVVSSNVTVPIVASVRKMMTAVALTGALPNSIIKVAIEREGTLGADSHTGTIYCLGVLFSYSADS